MISVIFQVESDFDVPVWIGFRVGPSQSNPSDILSRETVVEFGGAEKAEVDPWEMWSLLNEKSSITGTLRGESTAVGSVTAISPF